MKFSTKKYLTDREESYQRSKKGELNTIISRNKVIDLDHIVVRLHEQRAGHYEEVIACKHRTLSCGCDLPVAKRKIITNGYCLCNFCNAGNPNL